jgi:hypothetical protein
MLLARIARAMLVTRCTSFCAAIFCQCSVQMSTTGFPRVYVCFYCAMIGYLKEIIHVNDRPMPAGTGRLLEHPLKAVHPAVRTPIRRLPTRGSMTQPPSAAPPEMAGQDTTLLLLPHDVLVNLFWRLEVDDLRRVAATYRLLQYGQSSPQTPNAVEDALRLQAGPGFWTSGALPVNARGGQGASAARALAGRVAGPAAPLHCRWDRPKPAQHLPKPAQHFRRQRCPAAELRRGRAVP